MRPRVEIHGALMEQVGFLIASCNAFDAGNVAEAKRIANSIYTLVVDKGRSKSILTQLEVKSGMDFIASGDDVSSHDKKILFENPPLLMIKFGATGVSLVPRLGLLKQDYRHLSYKDWWEEDPVFRVDGQSNDQKTSLLSRKGLITSLTDQDGGRHFDSKLTQKNYIEIKNETIPVIITLADGEKQSIELTRVELLTARQIGWELLASLERTDLLSKIVE
jgi:hypothetical protein